ncbi:BON domain-containing protein [Methylomicrobium sp. RS1]|jgi:osmotically-inducible protein OsmY|uniref:BON domain-containing protein n=1 Tax=Candidatus Methylomicrobium oryzae TaxID=2802053 RepID=UPI0019250A97|nr:BON domain-containing protein [Methylomicrobium sp. RS1]MBL1263570.1 BON domain-containing protein [Methylomicrobium sp. RS1]
MKIGSVPAIIGLSAFTAQLSGCGYGELIRLYFQEQEYQKDQELIAEIKGALLADSDTRHAPVEIEAYLGDVRLSGMLASSKQKQRAEDITEQVSGVESVVNAIEVRGR